MKLIDAWAGTAPFDARSRLLRRVLLCNAGSSFLFAALLLGAGHWTAGLIGAPEAGPLLQVLGGGLLVFALGVEWVATRVPLQPSHGWAVVALDISWVVGSAVLLPFLASRINLLGEAAIIAVALVVLGWALGQIRGLRQLEGAAPVSA
ncbi:hypothetical protein [Tepidicaulis sp.]|uniref:hypothetical protein n=1 Tax=Tepidicaulis sp. TaxID=1920809 RepID=UPI003B5CD564